MTAIPKGITLVSCCRDKLGRCAAARQLYKSPLFQKSARWAERQGNDWFVLSARYGLIKPDDRLMPYDHSVRNMSPVEREAWAKHVADQLGVFYRDVDPLEVTLLAGAAYSVWIPLVQNRCTVHQPMDGMQIGQRLQWLTRQLETA